MSYYGDLRHGGPRRAEVATQPRRPPADDCNDHSDFDGDGDDRDFGGDNGDHNPDGSNGDDDVNKTGGSGNGNGNGNPLTDLAELEQLLDEAERMKGLGNRHMANQEYTKAYNAYSAAVQLSPSGPNSHVFLSNRAAALLSLKRYSAAADDARRAAALQPTFGKAHARLGQSLYFLRDYEGAVAAYEEAVKYDFDNAVTWTYLAKAKAKLVKLRTREAQASSREKLERLERDVAGEGDGGGGGGGTELPSAESILRSLQIQESERGGKKTPPQNMNNGTETSWQDEYVNRSKVDADNANDDVKRTSPHYGGGVGSGPPPGAFRRTSPRGSAVGLRGAPSRDYSETGGEEEEKRPVDDHGGEEPSISGISPTHSGSFDSGRGREGRGGRGGGAGMSPGHSESFESHDDGSSAANGAEEEYESPRMGIQPPTYERQGEDDDGWSPPRGMGAASLPSSRPGLGSRSTSVNDAIDELAEEFANDNDEVPVGRGHLILAEMRARKHEEVHRPREQGEEVDRYGEQGEEVDRYGNVEEDDEGDYREDRRYDDERDAARTEMLRSASIEESDEDGDAEDDGDQENHDGDDYGEEDSEEDDGEPYVVTRSQQERGLQGQQRQQQQRPGPPQAQFDNAPDGGPPPPARPPRGGPVDLDDEIEESPPRRPQPPEGDIDHAFRRGNHHLGRKEFNMAIDEYTAALDLMGDDDDDLLEDEILADVAYKIRINRANAYNNLRRHEEASHDARRAVDIRPDDHVGYSVLGKSLFYLRDYEGTLTALTESFALNQEDEPSIFDRAYFDKAKEALGRNIEREEGGGADKNGIANNNNSSPSRGHGQPKNAASSNSSPTRSSRVAAATAGSPTRSNASSAASASTSSSTGLITPKNANKPVPRLRPPRFVSREEALSSAPSLPPMPSKWPQQSLPGGGAGDGGRDGLGPAGGDTFRVGPERDVTFWDGPMGIKLNRGTDGIVRIISTAAASAAAASPGGVARREGRIDVGDVVREAAGVDLRRPITNIMWGDTVALIKMTPRPVVLVVARELSRPPAAAAEELARAAAEDMEAAMLRPPDKRNLGGGGVGGGAARVGRSVLPSPAIGEASVEDFVAGQREPEGQRGGEGPGEDSPGVAAPLILNSNPNGGSSASSPGEHNPETVSFDSNGDDDVGGEENDAVVPVSVDKDDDSAKVGPAAGGGKSGDGTEGVDDDDAFVSAAVEGSTSSDGSAPLHDEGVVPPEKDLAHGKAAGEDDGDDGAMITAADTSPTSSSSSHETPPPVSDAAVEPSGPTSTPPSSPPSTPPQATSRKREAPLTPRQREIRALGGEILFDPPPRPEAQDAPPSPDRGGPGGTWSNNRWLSTSDARVLRHCGVVTKVSQPRRLSAIFGGGENYECRMLALFHDPDLILLLRRPKNAGEVRKLLILPKNVELGGGLGGDNGSVVDSFWVAENVIDPKMCKIRLSNLTTTTSLYVGPSEKGSSSSAVAAGNGRGGGGGDGNNIPSSPNNNNDRFRPCFELITPSESFLLSAVPLGPFSIGGRGGAGTQDDDNESFLETNCWEMALSNSILAAHNPHGFLTDQVQEDQAWRHQVVLGALHSHVVVGNDALLRRVLEGGNVEVDVDAVDECGRTALHYACARRSNVAVRLLVGTGGADCSIPTRHAAKTPCHISAEHLDERSLSTILSATSGRRPDPNALDGAGRTPMHVAAVDGRAVGGSRDPRALALCLSALEAWGGRLTVSPDALLEQCDDGSADADDPKVLALLRRLDHPVFTLSSQWRAEDLDVVLRQDFSSIGGGMSLGSSFCYPIHAALLSLRRRVMLIKEKHMYPTDKKNVIVGTANAASRTSTSTTGLFQISALVRTLRVLLDNGMEPNERCEALSVRGSTIARAEGDSVVGFTPLQILAVTALEATALLRDNGQEREQEEEVRKLTRMMDDHRIMQDIADAAECLVLAGARLSVSMPPLLRHKQKSLSSLSADSCQSENDVAPAVSAGFPPVDRSALTIEGNDELLDALGGAERLNAARTSWSSLTPRTVPCGERIHLLEKKPSAIEDSDVPGGSDERTCAVCWRPFGMVMNRRHTCRVTLRYVCEECSTKRVVKNGEEFRVSDGQFLLARAEEARRAKIKEETEDKSKVLMQTPKTRTQQQQHAATSQSEKEELFGSVGKSVMNFITGGEEDEEDDVGSSLGGLTSSLGQAKDSLNERGEKLSTLSDKTAALANASKDFASMAKSLNESQQGGFFW